MINPVSSSSSAYAVNPQPAQAPPAPKPADSPKDTVQLSPAAKGVAGDVDHDGDSH